MVYGKVYDKINKMVVFTRYDDSLIDKVEYRYASIPEELLNVDIHMENGVIEAYKSEEEKLVNNGIRVLDIREKIVDGIISYKTYRELIDEGTFTEQEFKLEVDSKYDKRDNDMIKDIAVKILETILIPYILIDDKYIKKSSEVILSDQEKAYLYSEYIKYKTKNYIIDYGSELDKPATPV